MNEAIKKIFEKIDIKIILATIYLFTIAFVFIPKQTLENLKLLEFKNSYQFVISLFFIIITCYYIVIFMGVITGKIKFKIFMKARKKSFDAISAEEKGYLVNFYDFEHDRLGTSCTFDMTDGTVALLESRQIISRASSVSKGMTNFSYILQPWAFEIMNKKIANKDLVIKLSQKNKKTNTMNGFYDYGFDQEPNRIEYMWK